MDEFEQRARQLGDKDYFTAPEVATVLGISSQTLWRWSRESPEAMPEWQRVGDYRFLNRHQCLDWCRQLAKTRPDLMARRVTEK